MNPINTLIMATTLTVGALAAGCQTTTAIDNTQPHAHSKITTQPITNSTLQAYNWQLVDAVRANGQKVNALFIKPNQPLTLNFMTTDSGDIVNFENTCNNISSPYRIENGEVKLGSIMSTMKACPDAEAKFDEATVQTIMGTYTLSKNSNDVPVLVISNNNQVAHFKAVNKAQ